MKDERKDLKSLLDAFRKGALSEEAMLDRISADRRDGADPASPDSDEGEASLEMPAVESAGVHAVLGELDTCRAAEASGSTTMESWAELSNDPVLAGGLRTAAAREATHALLLERRVRELGMEPEAALPGWLVRFNAAILDSKASDLDRLGALVAQFPDIEEALEPLNALIDAVADDALTHELLSTIRDDERVTLRWMHASYERVSRETSENTRKRG